MELSASLKILVVDDSRTVAYALAGQLREEGLECDLAHDFATARARVLEADYDLVLLDLFLPDVEGLEGLEWLRATKPDLTVVILTGHDDSDVAVQALKSGAQDYLIKGEGGQLLFRTLAFAHERNQVRKQLEDLNRQKNQFLGMAAHDLRNPLTAINGISNLLAETTVGVLDESQRELITHIETASGFMLQLIDDLLDISTIELGRLELQTDQVDLGMLLSQTVARHGFLARPKDISLVSEVPAEPMLLEVDVRRIVQVFDNFLSNAIKYSPPGTTTRIRLESEDGGVTVSVIDQGPGIAADEQARLFEPFERASTRTTGGEQSTGLGLSIAKKIVDAHGGRVGLESAVGSGSRFWVWLPGDA